MFDAPMHSLTGTGRRKRHPSVVSKAIATCHGIPAPAISHRRPGQRPDSPARHTSSIPCWAHSYGSPGLGINPNWPWSPWVAMAVGNCTPTRMSISWSCWGRATATAARTQLGKLPDPVVGYRAGYRATACAASAECVEKAAEDITVLTNLMEARVIRGPSD